MLHALQSPQECRAQPPSCLWPGHVCLHLSFLSHIWAGASLGSSAGQGWCPGGPVRKMTSREDICAQAKLGGPRRRGTRSGAQPLAVDLQGWVLWV